VVDRSTGTDQKRDAQKILRRWAREIERGEYADPKAAAPVERKGQLCFGQAAVAYMQAGGERAYLGRILAMSDEGAPARLRKLALGPLPLDEITQDRIDNAAAALYPHATGATRNRHFYTPVVAALRHVGFSRLINRPEGAQGTAITAYLEPEQAFALFAAADSVDAEFGMLCRLLCYTGMRRSEALNIKIRDVALSEARIHLPKTKNGKPRGVHLPPDIVVALANHPRGLDRHPDERLILDAHPVTLGRWLKLAMKKAGLTFGPREGGFHLFCHTYGTWMVRYNGMSSFDLARTGRWADPRSADRYNHMAVHEHARKADNLPKAGGLR
jgi:integrase